MHLIRLFLYFVLGSILLFGISGLKQAEAGHIIGNIEDFIKCGATYDEMGDSRAQKCSINGTITDRDGIYLQGAKAIIYYKDPDSSGGLHESGRVEVDVSPNGYTFCAYPETSFEYPAAYRIGLWAPGYKEATWDINTLDVCKNSDGHDLGGTDNLEPSEEQWGCISPEGACRDLGTNPQGNVEEEFPNQNSCTQECGIWHLYYNRSVDEYWCLNTLNDSPPAAAERVNQEDYFLEYKCINEMNNSRPNPGMLTVPTPPPTNTPPQAPCAAGLRDIDDIRRLKKVSGS